MRAVASGDGFTLSGIKRHVFFGGAADALIVLARTDAGIDLFLVDVATEGLQMRQQRSVAYDTQFEVELSTTSPIWPAT